MLTPAEADALAARFKPTYRAGVNPWTPLTLEAHRQIADTLSRPVTDTVHSDGVRVIDGVVRVQRHQEPRKSTVTPEQREKRLAYDQTRREAARERRAAERTAVMRQLRADAYAESLALRSNPQPHGEAS